MPHQSTMQKLRVFQHCSKALELEHWIVYFAIKNGVGL